MEEEANVSELIKVCLFSKSTWRHVQYTITPEKLCILRHDSRGTDSVFIVDLNATIKSDFATLAADYQKYYCK